MKDEVLVKSMESLIVLGASTITSAHTMLPAGDLILSNNLSVRSPNPAHLYGTVSSERRIGDACIRLGGGVSETGVGQNTDQGWGWNGDRLNINKNTEAVLLRGTPTQIQPVHITFAMC